MSTVIIARTQTLTAGTALTQLSSTIFPTAAVSFTLTGTGASLATAQIAIVGLDANGAPQNENVATHALGAYTSVNQYSSITSITPSGIVFTGYSGLVTFADAFENANGDDDTTDYATLTQLRTRLLIRLGFAAQATTPPPGMALLLTDFLQSAQTFWMKKYKEQRQMRFFTWVMTPGIRFYGIANNQDLSNARLDPLKLEWVGISDTNQSWSQLVAGIRPEFYTMVAQRGRPSRYTIGGQIEILAAPDVAYRLRIRAGFKAGAFAADNDQTSIDSELVFLWALANAKNHYGQADADAVATQARSYFGQIIAGGHKTNRYIPGADVGPPMTKPRFLPLEQ